MSRRQSTSEAHRGGAARRRATAPAPLRIARPAQTGDRDDREAMLLAEMHHRVANSLSLASAMLGMQARRSDEVAVRRALREAQSRLWAIASVHSRLQQIRGEDCVCLPEFLEGFLPVIGESIGVGYAFSAGEDDIHVSGSTASHLGIAINELSLNALKHGHPGKTDVQIAVTLDRPEADLARLELQDGGTGFAGKIDLAQGRGLGLTLVRSLLEVFDGTLSIRNANGACFTIDFPLE